MAADLHIHVLEPPCTEADLAEFFSSTLGSKWFAGFRSAGMPLSERESWAHVMGTPNIWVGEVSWLKASLSGDVATFVPNAVATIHDLIGEELPVLDDDLRSKIVGALEQPNTTGYSVADRDSSVNDFLKQHMGKRLFTVSW